MPPHPLPSVPYLCVPSLPSQPQEGPGSPKHWYYLCAPHLCPPLCWNLTHPTKGNRWCTTVHGMTSVSVGGGLLVNSAAGGCSGKPMREDRHWPSSVCLNGKFGSLWGESLALLKTYRNILHHFKVTCMENWFRVNTVWWQMTYLQREASVSAELV